ncbi:sensor histidine kinase [Amycolatopsis sp. cg5]|uniref:sensor histidine kinase n=1 Tax=Amycolatopsis sp. cg5 TaxID=3238802 RepID=UPI0035268B83
MKRVRPGVRLVVGELGRRRFGAELGWVLAGVPLAAVCFVLVVVGLAVGVVVSPLFVGLLLLSGVLVFVRALGGVHRRLAGALLGVKVGVPASRPMEPGFGKWFKARIGDPIAWRAVAYLVLRVPVAAGELLVTAYLVVGGVATLLYPLFWHTTGGREMPMFAIRTDTWWLSLPLALLGVVILVALPWVIRLMVGVDRLLVRGLLGPKTLSERVRDLEVSRAAAVEDADVKLRRIERDLHDGAQAQLVALAMKLGIAKDELDATSPDVAQLRQLVTTAHANAKQALVDLRDLARGIHPPALDAGLDVALSTLVTTLGVDVVLDVDVGTRPPPSLETIAYFTAAELLTNAAKHARDGIHLQVRATDTLEVAVSDRGDGGATVTPGGGLAGITERLRTVDGTLDVSSPRGGPTVVTASIPLTG